MEIKNLKSDNYDVHLSFLVESNASLWNKIFEGFDQESFLVSRFEGDSPASIRLLYKFGSLIHKKFSDCKVESKSYGIVIKKKMGENDNISGDEWMKLMSELQQEICSILMQSETIPHSRIIQKLDSL